MAKFGGLLILIRSDPLRPNSIKLMLSGVDLNKKIYLKVLLKDPIERSLKELFKRPNRESLLSFSNEPNISR